MNPKAYKQHQWVDEFPGAITVCAKDGTILEMNKRSEKTFVRDGGKKLVGKDLRQCHPPAARVKIDSMMASGRTNAYTIEKDGVKKLIYQAPWYEDGKRLGLVEISLEIPKRMRHFKRA
ncbi:MAG: PAS domain-containing protein [Methanobacteriota archaeon]